MAGFRKLKEYVKKFNKLSDGLVKDFANDTATVLLRRSPVKTGQFRANWYANIDAPITYSKLRDDNKVSFGQPYMSKIELENMGSVFQAKVGDNIFITNSLPYAQGLENGKSKMAPAGVLHLTAREMKAEWQG